MINPEASPNLGQSYKEAIGVIWNSAEVPQLLPGFRAGVIYEQSYYRVLKFDAEISELITPNPIKVLLGEKLEYAHRGWYVNYLLADLDLEMIYQTGPKRIAGNEDTLVSDFLWLNRQDNDIVVKMLPRYINRINDVKLSHRQMAFSHDLQLGMLNTADWLPSIANAIQERASHLG